MDELIGAAKAARAAGRLREAARLYESAAATGPAGARAHRLRHAGEIHLELDELDRAEAALEEALDCYRALPNVAPLDVANALRPLALLREAQGRLAEARSAWTEAGRLYAEASAEPGVRESTRRLAALG